MTTARRTTSRRALTSLLTAAVGAALVTTTLVAPAMSLGAGSLGAGSLGAGPTGPAAPAPEQLRFKDLSKGPAPATPYVVDRVLIDGDVRVDLPKGVTRFVGRTGDDYVMQGYRPQSQKEVVARVTPLGAIEILVSSRSLSDATLSPDGTSFVASDSGSNRRTEVRWYDAGTGDVRRKAEIGGYARVLGFDGTRAVLGVVNPSKTLAWTVETGKVTTIARVWGYEADLANDRLAWFTKDPYLGGCSVVSPLSDPSKELWRRCDEAVEAFSADGSHMVTTHILADGLGPGRFTLRRTTGRSLGVFEAPYYFGRIWFEDASHVLAEAFGKTKGAVVRCDAGGCERATKVTAHDVP